MDQLAPHVVELLKQPMGPTLWVFLMLAVAAGIGVFCWVVLKQYTKITEGALKGQEQFPAAIGELRVALALHAAAAKQLAEEVHLVSRAVSENLHATQEMHADNTREARERHEELVRRLTHRSRGAGS